MNIKNYILIGILSFFLLNSNCLYPQTSEQKMASIPELKAKKRVIKQFMDIFMEYDFSSYTSGKTSFFVSIIQESEKTYNITISSSDYIMEPIFTILMANCYRFQPFIGKWLYKGFDVYLYGNGVDHFFRPYHKTIILKTIAWITSLENHSYCYWEPNEFTSYTSDGLLLCRYDYAVLYLVYNKRKTSAIIPPPMDYSYDDLTEEENRFYNSFSPAPRTDTLTLKQLQSKIKNKQY